jgi:hypothetical protein
MEDLGNKQWKHKLVADAAKNLAVKAANNLKEAKLAKEAKDVMDADDGMEAKMAPQVWRAADDSDGEGDEPDDCDSEEQGSSMCPFGRHKCLWCYTWNGASLVCDTCMPCADERCLPHSVHEFTGHVGKDSHCASSCFYK